MNASRIPTPLDARARSALAAGLNVVDARTDAPLRLHMHHAHANHDVFELREESETGGPGRRFLLSVDHAARNMLVMAPAAASR